MTSIFRLPASLILLVLALALAIAGPAQAQVDDESNSIDDTPHITIIGSAHVAVAPDLATITLGVGSEKPTAREASDETSRAAQAVLATAKAQGVAGADITTQAVTLTQTFDETHDASRRDTGQKPRGFAAANTFAIKIRDLAKAGALAQSLIEAGANRFDGIVFSVEDSAPILDRLASEAVRNARRKAQLVADAAGVKLGRVLLVEHPSTERASPVFAARTTFAAVTMPVEPGSTDFSSEMEVTWSIER